VAAAKLRRAQNAVTEARPYAESIERVLARVSERTEYVHPLLESRDGDRAWVVVITSDKGLCGSLNSQLVRPLQLEIREERDAFMVACLGAKGRNGLAAGYKENIWFHVSEFGKAPITFAEVSYCVDQMLNSPEAEELGAQVVRIQYNYYINMVQSELKDVKFLSKSEFVNQEMYEYEMEGGISDKEVMGDLYDYLIAGASYGGMSENQAAELGMRMSGMDNATKNCGEVLEGLNLLYNRQRQAAITTELSEIVAGAESVKDEAE